MISEIILELHIFFDSNMDKVVAWLNMKNLNLGGARPIDMIKMGKIKRLHQFVMTQVGENVL